MYWSEQLATLTYAMSKLGGIIRRDPNGRPYLDKSRGQKTATIWWCPKTESYRVHLCCIGTPPIVHSADSTMDVKELLDIFYAVENQEARHVGHHP